MSPRFGEGANRLAGLAARALGWLPDQFWQATPAELTAAFAPFAGTGSPGLSRTEFTAMMERDHD